MHVINIFHAIYSPSSSSLLAPHPHCVSLSLETLWILHTNPFELAMAAGYPRGYRLHHQCRTRLQRKAVARRARVVCAASGSSGIYESDDSSVISKASTSVVSENETKAQEQEQEEEEALLVRAARGEAVPRTPVWLFRQAGRHLPEYNEYKRARGRNFLELLRDPDDVAEITLQPLRRYPLDAAVLFSDILVIPQALGIDVIMVPGSGINVPQPLRTAADAQALLTKHEALDLREDVVFAQLAHVLEGAERVAAGLRAGGLANDAEGVAPLIGFSAAPWTLFYYMVGGSSKRATDSGTRWLRDEPVLSEKLLSMLTDLVIEYLVAQVDSGARVLQIFEAMGEHIGREDFERFATPCLVKICRELKTRRPKVPLMVFTRDAMHAIDDMQRANYDVITLDLSVRAGTVRRQLEANRVTSSGLHIPSLQGNFDPSYLLPSAPGWESEIESAVRFMLEDAGAQRLIFNIGAGLTGQEEPEKVLHLVESVRDISSALLS